MDDVDYVGVRDSMVPDLVVLWALINLAVRADTIPRPQPVVVEVQRDVEVRRSEGGSERRGTLYTNAQFRIRKGERFLMLRTVQEGSCRIRFHQREYELSSCPWVDGFTDHQADIFKVITPKNTKPVRSTD